MPLRLLSLAGTAGIVLLALAGCGTVSREQCQAGDWYGIGVTDGREGRPESRIDDHAESCARFKLPIDRAAWDAGRTEGLREYCTPISGYANGVAGRTYHDVCSGPAGGSFITAYALGSDVHRARAEAERAAAEARRIEDEIDRIGSEIAELQDRLDDADRDRRGEIRDRIDRLRDRRFDLTTDAFAARRLALRAADEARMIEESSREAYARAFGVPPAI